MQHGDHGVRISLNEMADDKTMSDGATRRVGWFAFARPASVVVCVNCVTQWHTTEANSLAITMLCAVHLHAAFTPHLFSTWHLGRSQHVSAWKQWLLEG